jgi:hypothetical protein
MEFIHHDVVEMLRWEAFEMAVLPKRLHRGAQHIDRLVTLLAGVEADAAMRADAQESGGGLVQNFLAMSDE